LFYKLSRRSFILGLLALAAGLKPARAATLGAPVSFAFISDVHLCLGIPDNSLKLTQESQLFLQDAVKQLNSLNLDFVVFGGDQVEGPGANDAHWQLFLDVVQGLNCPWYFVLGENDVTGPAAVDKMRTYGLDLKGKGLDTQNSYWSIDPIANQPLHVIGLDTARANSTTGDINPGQLDWLKKDLEANKGKYTVIFSHHPLLAPPPYDGGPPFEEYTCPAGACAREILAEYPDVKMAVSGHLPINKIQRERNLWYVAGAALTVYPCQFKVFHLHPQAIEVETHQISFPALVKKAQKIMLTSRLAYQYSSKKPAKFLPMAEGSTVDRDAILAFAPGAMPFKSSKQKTKAKKLSPQKVRPKQEKERVKTPTAAAQESPSKVNTNQSAKEGTK
jgi:hypothetical protein